LNLNGADRREYTNTPLLSTISGSSGPSSIAPLRELPMMFSSGVTSKMLLPATFTVMPLSKA